MTIQTDSVECDHNFKKLAILEKVREVQLFKEIFQISSSEVF